MSTQEVRLADPVGTSAAYSTTTTSVSPADNSVIAAARRTFADHEVHLPSQPELEALRRMQIEALRDALEASGEQIHKLDALNNTFNTQNSESLEQLRTIGAYSSDLAKQVLGLQKATSSYKPTQTDVSNYTAISKKYEAISETSVKLCQALKTTIGTLDKLIADFAVPANTTSGGLAAMERDLGVSKKAFAGVLNSKTGARTKCIETQWRVTSDNWVRERNALSTSLEQLDQHDTSIISLLDTYRKIVYQTQSFFNWPFSWAQQPNTVVYRHPEAPSATESTTEPLVAAPANA